MDKSKENTRVADLMSMDASVVQTKIIMGIENPAIFNNLMENGLSNLNMWPYAVAAGLIDWDDLKWIKEHVNSESGN